jgi:hypothetical protein
MSCTFENMVIVALHNYLLFALHKYVDGGQPGARSLSVVRCLLSFAARA